MAEFEVGGVVVDVVRSEASDISTEFHVHGETPTSFAIYRNFDEGWENAMISIRGLDQEISVKVMEFAIAFARDNA